MLYVAQQKEVFIYAQSGPHHHTPLGSITDGIDHPWGMSVDAAGTLYVANRAGSVTLYPAGSVHPSLTITNGLNRPQSVVVGADGTVYAMNTAGDIPEYLAGQTTPFLDIPRVYGGSSTYLVPVDAALDTANDLFVAYLFLGSPHSFDAEIAEYAPGSTTPVWTGINPAYSGDIAFDAKGHLVVAVPFIENSPTGISVYDLSGPKLLKIFGDTSDAWAMRFAAGARTLYVGDAHQHKVFVYAYPAGKLIDTISQDLHQRVLGVALSPPGPY